MPEDPITAVARDIESHLEAIVGDDADGVRARLDPLLGLSDVGHDVGGQLHVILMSDSRLRLAAAQRLEDADGLLAAYPGGPPGEPNVVGARLYGCLQCDYQYPTFDAGESVPNCPRGHGALHRVS